MPRWTSFQEPLLVGLVVHLVTHADKMFAAGSGLKLGDDGGDRRVGEVDPSDNAGHKVSGLRSAEELPGLREAWESLDDDRLVDPALREKRLEVLRAEWPSNRVKLAGHPVVVAQRGIPEMVVGIDHHRHGVGASSRSSPLVLSSCHSAGGMSTSNMRMLSSS